MARGTRINLAASHFRTLADAVRNSARFADADADAAFVVAHNDYGTEGKAATALDNLGNALNINDAFVKLFFVFVAVTARFTVTARFVVATSRLFRAASTFRRTSTRPAKFYFLWLVSHFLLQP